MQEPSVLQRVFDFLQKPSFTWRTDAPVFQPAQLNEMDKPYFSKNQVTLIIQQVTHQCDLIVEEAAIRESACASVGDSAASSSVVKSVGDSAASSSFGSSSVAVPASKTASLSVAVPASKSVAPPPANTIAADTKAQKEYRMSLEDELWQEELHELEEAELLEGEARALRKVKEGEEKKEAVKEPRSPPATFVDAGPIIDHS